MCSFLNFPSNWYTAWVMSTSGFTTAIFNFQLKGAFWGVWDGIIESETSKNIGVDTEIVLLCFMETDLH